MENLQENIDFAEIAPLSLRELKEEPERLEKQKQNLKKQIIDESSKNYESFLKVSNTTSILSQQSKQIQEHLENLIKSLDTLKETTDDLYQEANEISKERAKSRMALRQYDKIISLLEIPQLTDICIRNGLYGEALELEDYSRQIHRSHPDIPILEPIRIETESRIQTLLSRLITNLRSNIEIPTCINIVAHIRRMGILNDYELKILFIQQRILYLDSITQEMRNTNPYHYLMQYTEVLRNELFKIVTQYQAVFSNHVMVDDSILSSCIMHVVHPYLEQLKSNIAKISQGEELLKLLLECMSCGQTLAKVGADIRGLLVPIFENRISQLFKDTITNSINRFKNEMQQYRWVHNDVIIDDVSSEDKNGPSRELLKYPPAAEMMNDFIEALNQLRKCAPVSLKLQMMNTMKDALNQVIDIMSNLQFTYSFNDEEKTSYMNMCEVCVLFLSDSPPKVYIESFCKVSSFMF